MKNARASRNASYDLLVIGGGINGVGIARDAAGRGLRVALVEQGDLAQATSPASTKLIHGGLRYLEYYELRRENGLWQARVKPVGEAEAFTLPAHGVVNAAGPWVREVLSGVARHYARAYGTRAQTLIGGARGIDGLGRDLGGGLYTAEVDYLVRHELVRTDEDLLWRHTKLGLHVPAGTAARLAPYLDTARRDAAAE